MNEEILAVSTEERLHERREARITAGREAYARVRNGDHFRDWVSVADALAAIRDEAMANAHTNRPQGPPYRAELKKLDAREPWAATINTSTKAHCYWLIENLPAVTAWRDTIGDKRDEWNHPTTIKRNFERMTKPVEPKVTDADNQPIKPGSLQERHIELQEKHAALLALRGGAFPANLTPEALADLCSDHRNSDWLRRAGKALLDAAENVERSERIETSRSKRRR
jgi:hypothetical protein